MIRRIWNNSFAVATVIALAFVIFQAIDCSSPLTTEDVTGIRQTDTVVVVLADTIFMFDTVYTPADTIFVPGETLYVPLDTIFLPGDTVYLPGDTLFLPGDTIYVPLDTVYLPGDTVYMPPDTVFLPDTIMQFCARLEAPVQEIVWPLMNEAGTYALDFEAVLESDRPAQSLTVDIDGRLFEWSLAESLELRFEGAQGDDAIVRISHIPPPASGHAVDICMRVTRL